MFITNMGIIYLHFNNNLIILENLTLENKTAFSHLKTTLLYCIRENGMKLKLKCIARTTVKNLILYLSSL
jgi:hypothetical protein